MCLGLIWADSRDAADAIYSRVTTARATTRLTGQTGAVRAAAGCTEQQFHQLANFDVVTGSPNRAALRAQALALAKRNTRELALLSLDLDHFQHSNDTPEFASGNALRSGLGARLRASDLTVVR